MNETKPDEARRRRRDFIRAHHPDRGGDPQAFIAGLRAFGTDPGQDSGLLPRVIIIRRRAWLIRQASAAAQRLRHGPRPARVR
jgi:hypothetical protein